MLKSVFRVIMLLILCTDIFQAPQNTLKQRKYGMAMAHFAQNPWCRGLVTKLYRLVVISALSIHTCCYFCKSMTIRETSYFFFSWKNDQCVQYTCKIRFPFHSLIGIYTCLGPIICLFFFWRLFCSFYRLNLNDIWMFKSEDECWPKLLGCM